jgi:hypothetical protein
MGQWVFAGQAGELREAQGQAVDSSAALGGHLSVAGCRFARRAIGYRSGRLTHGEEPGCGFGQRAVAERAKGF